MADENGQADAESSKPARPACRRPRASRSQMDSLKEEREVIRTRVSSLLEQLESLNL